MPISEIPKIMLLILVARIIIQTHRRVIFYYVFDFWQCCVRSVICQVGSLWKEMQRQILVSLDGFCGLVFLITVLFLHV